jgi:hypothetical protein
LQVSESGAGEQLAGSLGPSELVVAGLPGPTSAITPERILAATFSVRTAASKLSLRAISDTASTADNVPDS